MPFGWRHDGMTPTRPIRGLPRPNAADPWWSTDGAMTHAPTGHLRLLVIALVVLSGATMLTLAFSLAVGRNYSGPDFTRMARVALKGATRADHSQSRCLRVQLILRGVLSVFGLVRQEFQGICAGHPDHATWGPRAIARR